MTLRRWLPTFLAFPLGGGLAILVAGPLDGVPSATLGGLIAGAVIGAGQWLALRPVGIGLRWVLATAVALATGAASAALLTGAGTAPGDLALTGLVAGAFVGAAQSVLLARGRRTSAVWTAATAVVWALGWLTTWAWGIDVERGYHVFGSSGAVVVTILTGLVLRSVLAAREQHGVSPTSQQPQHTAAVNA